MHDITVVLLLDEVLFTGIIISAISRHYGTTPVILRVIAHVLQIIHTSNAAGKHVQMLEFFFGKHSNIISHYNRLQKSSNV